MESCRLTFKTQSGDTRDSKCSVSTKKKMALFHPCPLDMNTMNTMNFTTDSLLHFPATHPIRSVATEETKGQLVSWRILDCLQLLFRLLL